MLILTPPGNWRGFIWDSLVAGTPSGSIHMALLTMRAIGRPEWAQLSSSHFWYWQSQWCSQAYPCCTEARWSLVRQIDPVRPQRLVSPLSYFLQRRLSASPPPSEGRVQNTASWFLLASANALVERLDPGQQAGFFVICGQEWRRSRRVEGS